MANFGKEFGIRPGAKSLQVLSAALQAEAIHGIQENHSGAFQPCAALALQPEFPLLTVVFGAALNSLLLRPGVRPARR
jgi:hypothetical protein